MGVGIKAGSVITEIGTSDFLHAFFSTISHNLEENGWGSRFPEIMNELYQGELAGEKAHKVLGDFKYIQAELYKLSVDRVVWDIDNLELDPPWGSNISDTITSLGNYFVTSGGRDLFEVIFECLDYICSNSGSLIIKETPLFTGEEKGNYHIK